MLHIDVAMCAAYMLHMHLCMYVYSVAICCIYECITCVSSGLASISFPDAQQRAGQPSHALIPAAEKFNDSKTS